MVISSKIQTFAITAVIAVMAFSYNTSAAKASNVSGITTGKIIQRIEPRVSAPTVESAAVVKSASGLMKVARKQSKPLVVTNWAQSRGVNLSAKHLRG